MELKLYCLPDDTFHASSFHGHEYCILKLSSILLLASGICHSSPVLAYIYAISPILATSP
jgi:hypothetical protein